MKICLTIELSADKQMTAVEYENLCKHIAKLTGNVFHANPEVKASYPRLPVHKSTFSYATKLPTEDDIRSTMRRILYQVINIKPYAEFTFATAYDEEGVYSWKLADPALRGIVSKRFKSYCSDSGYELVSMGKKSKGMSVYRLAAKATVYQERSVPVEASAGEQTIVES